MSKALSLDLRERALAAVSEGASHRVAGARFGVSAASISRWRRLQREQGHARPGPLGGDRRSGRIEALGPTIMALIAEQPDLTLDEVRLALLARGHAFSVAAVWRFFDRHGQTLKKRPRTRPSRSGPTS